MPTLPDPTPQEVAILKSADIATYNDAITAFKANLPNPVIVKEYNMQGDLTRGRKMARKIRASDPDVVLAVGSKAVVVAKLEIIDIPVIFCMVLNPAKYDLTAENMRGITLQIPIRRQLSTIRWIIPDRKRIGIVYDPTKTSDFVEEARRESEALELELLARQVSSEKEVPAALRAILSEIDALWVLPDSTVINKDSLSFLLSTALEANVPIIGFSQGLVRSGALLSFYIKHEDVGRQAAQVAKKILNGKGLPLASMMPPEPLRFAINLKIAKFLGISIPPDITRQSDEVF